jgi:hypothetical protein
MSCWRVPCPTCQTYLISVIYTPRSQPSDPDLGPPGTVHPARGLQGSVVYAGSMFPIEHLNHMPLWYCTECTQAYRIDLDAAERKEFQLLAAPLPWMAEPGADSENLHQQR